MTTLLRKYYLFLFLSLFFLPSLSQAATTDCIQTHSDGTYDCFQATSRWTLGGNNSSYSTFEEMKNETINRMCSAYGSAYTCYEQVELNNPPLPPGKPCGSNPTCGVFTEKYDTTSSTGGRYAITYYPTGASSYLQNYWFIYHYRTCPPNTSSVTPGTTSLVLCKPPRPITYMKDCPYGSTSHKLTSLSGASTDTMTYDSNGNILSASGKTYTYNAANRMATSNDGSLTTSYLINFMGQRTKKSNTTDSTWFIYDENDNVIAEYDAAGNLTNEYVYLDNRPVALIRSSNLYYIYTDHLNTPRAITDTANNLQWTWENKEAFGNNAPTEVVTGFKFNFRLPGQYFDSETNLNYNIHRDYNPAWGRYMSSDPLGLAAGVNTYGYVSGNSLWFSDSLGLDNRTIVNLGMGYIGGIDKFPYGGETGFEIHVFDKNNKEVGMYGPKGWFNKHGLTGRPEGVPESVELQCKGQAINMGRKLGKIPVKGVANIKGNNWKIFLKSLPMVSIFVEETKPSPQRACEINPEQEFCNE